MAEYCTCGAELPPEARFCHKCGKPQFEEPLPQARPREELLRTPQAINFRNSLAVHIGFVGGLLANLLILFPYLVLGSPLWLAGAGFVGVRLYVRRSGQALSVPGGARLGWITGVFAFVIFTVFFTLNFLAAFRSGLFTDRAQLSRVPLLQGNADHIIEMMQSPTALALNLVFSLAVLFLVFVGFAMAGGALGARLLRRN